MNRLCALAGKVLLIVMGVAGLIGFVIITVFIVVADTLSQWSAHIINLVQSNEYIQPVKQE